MSQALFVFPLDPTFKADFDRTLVLSILSEGDISSVTSGSFEYADGSGGEPCGFDDPKEPIDSIMFTHFGGRTMFERLFGLASALDVFLVWTDMGEDEPNACVARAEQLMLARRLVNDMRIVVARDASHLHDLLKGGTFEEMGW